MKYAVTTAFDSYGNCFLSIDNMQIIRHVYSLKVLFK
jgi:hypothetical protein